MGLSTHILDTAIGRPVAGVAVVLSCKGHDEWFTIGSGTTDTDGRCKTLLGDTPLVAATYRLDFITARYFKEQGMATLYPLVQIVFTVTEPTEHYHIPLLLTANGYTTYRGS